MRHFFAALVVLALAGCSTATAGTAAPEPAPVFAPTPEQAFRDNLKMHGITTGSEESDLRLGSKVCFHWEHTTDTFDDVYGMFVDMTGLSRDDTALFMVVATTQLCPYELDKIPGQ
jgi:hypothetical protein